MKLGTKLGDNKGTKVTEPDFPKKFWIIQKFKKKWHFLRFFDFLLSKSVGPFNVFLFHLDVYFLF